MSGAADMGALAAIEARLQRVEGGLAILRIIYDYSAYLDVSDWTNYVGLFAPDGEWTNAEGSYKGQAAIRKMLEDFEGPTGTSRNLAYHVNLNPRIDVEGDRAVAISRYLYVMQGDGNRPVSSLAGLYRDVFVRLDGTWKIQSRIAEEIIPTHDEWRKKVPAWNSD